MAHELGHEYIWAEHQRATKLGDHNRLKQLELMCDAIAIAYFMSSAWIRRDS
jgi:hypothetical protein